MNFVLLISVVIAYEAQLCQCIKKPKLSQLIQEAEEKRKALLPMESDQQTPNKVPSAHGGVTDMHRVYTFIFSDYDKHIRPAMTDVDITYVYFELSLFNVLKLDTKEQTMLVNSEIVMKWTDDHLKWDPADFNGIHEIRVPYVEIWKPDIILYNTADSNYESSIIYTNAIVSYEGEVELTSHALLTSVCDVDVQWYPFDQQTCEMLFAPWSYDNSEIVMLVGPADLSDFVDNPEYFIEDFFAVPKEIINPCCDIPFSTIHFYVQLQRRTNYAMFFFIMPGIIINICALATFSVPTEFGEKMNLAMNSLLAMIVFLMAMTEYMPATDKIPLAGVFYGSGLILIMFNILMTVYVMNLNIRGDRGIPVQRWIKLITLFLAKYMRVTISDDIRKSWNLDEDGSLKEVTLVVPFDAEKTQTTQDIMEECSQSEKNSTYTGNLEGCGTEPSASYYEKRMVKALEEILKIIGKADRIKTLERSEYVLEEEWKFISRVADRFFLVFFILITFILVMYSLASSPFMTQFIYCPLGPHGCEEMTREERMVAAHHATQSHGDGTGGSSHGGGSQEGEDGGSLNNGNAGH